MASIKKEDNKVVTVQKHEVAQQENPSVRFTKMVLGEYGNSVGAIALTDFQKRLVQNYFIVLDANLKTAEAKRLSKTYKQDPLPITWSNVNMEKLARDVVAYARVGLDPAQKNHINMMPFKSTAGNKYDIVFIEGYRGLELKAKKYGLDVPDSTTIKLVHKNDKFIPIMKDKNNPYETYEFSTNPFDPGEIIGGFYYHAYKDNPEKNRLVVLTMKDIEKRKPRYASTEFWGGEKEIWETDENGKNKKTGKTEKVEGWREEMCEKTIARAAWNDITIDSQKIDDAYMALRQIENDNTQYIVEAEIAENANQTVIDIAPAQTAETKEPADTDQLVLPFDCPEILK